jgi:hypothetical protein
VRLSIHYLTTKTNVMKKFIIILSLSIGISAVIALNSCKKEASAITSDDSISAQDNATISNAMNATSDDAVAAAGQTQSNSEKSDHSSFNFSVFCGLTLVDTGTPGHRFITITYDGTTNCFGVIRSGTITIADTSGLLWQDAGAVIIIAYNNLKVTDVMSGNSYTIQGSHILTKETAGLEWQVMAGIATNTTVATRNQAGMSITFSTGAQRDWKVDRTRSWGSVVADGHNTITTNVYSEGPGNVELSGMNRYGQSFTETILTAIEANNNARCLYKPYAGETQYITSNRTTTVVYGTNPEGVRIGSSRVCGDGYYITYVGERGTTTHRFVSYW